MWNFVYHFLFIKFRIMSQGISYTDRLRPNRNYIYNIYVCTRGCARPCISVCVRVLCACCERTNDRERMVLGMALSLSRHVTMTSVMKASSVNRITPWYDGFCRGKIAYNTDNTRTVKSERYKMCGLTLALWWLRRRTATARHGIKRCVLMMMVVRRRMRYMSHICAGRTTEMRSLPRRKSFAPTTPTYPPHPSTHTQHTPHIRIDEHAYFTLGVAVPVWLGKCQAEVAADDIISLYICMPWCGGGRCHTALLHSNWITTCGEEMRQIKTFYREM